MRRRPLNVIQSNILSTRRNTRALRPHHASISGMNGSESSSPRESSVATISSQERISTCSPARKSSLSWRPTLQGTHTSQNCAKISHQEPAVPFTRPTHIWNSTRFKAVATQTDKRPCQHKNARNHHAKEYQTAQSPKQRDRRQPRVLRALNPEPDNSSTCHERKQRSANSCLPVALPVTSQPQKLLPGFLLIFPACFSVRAMNRSAPFCRPGRYTHTPRMPLFLPDDWAQWPARKSTKAEIEVIVVTVERSGNSTPNKALWLTRQRRDGVG